MSEDSVNPHDEMQSPDTSGAPEPLPDSNTKNDAPKKKGWLHKAKRFAWKATKAATFLTVATSPIRGTPGNMILRNMQTAGLLPSVSNVEGIEIPYKDVADDTFANSISAAPLSHIPLEQANIQNYVFEPNGEDIPVFLLHGEHINIRDAVYRMNTNLYHGQNVAASYHHTLKKISGREPNVKLLDGSVSEGIWFNGPQIDLLGNSKTIVNNSVCISSLDRTDDVKHYNAWIFHAAGNIGDEVGSDVVQPQPGGLCYHAPRSVLIGAPYYYSSHCGPVFHCETPKEGKIKGKAPRIGFLPAAIKPGEQDNQGREAIYKGWGGTSNASPSAAARFSALMERYGNYLSEEQIFTALCHAIAKTTCDDLQTAQKQAVNDANKEEEKRLTHLLARYRSPAVTSNPDVFYDPLMHGFGELSQKALERADTLCQDMVLLGMYRPSSISKPTSYEARLNRSVPCTKEADGMYHYAVRLPGEVNLNNVVLQGTAGIADIEKAQIFIVTNGMKIRLPAGTTSVMQEYLGREPEQASFIGSTRGFTASGPTSHIEIISTVPLGAETSLTCYNTLDKADAVSRITDIPAEIARLQGTHPAMSLALAQPLNSSSIHPQYAPITVAMTPAHLLESNSSVILVQASGQSSTPSAPPSSLPEQQPALFWRKKEEDRFVQAEAGSSERLR
jgi:hypothetical protein